MHTSFLKSVTTYISNISKNSLVFAGIGLFCLLASIIIAANAHSSSQIDTNVKGTGTNGIEARQENKSHENENDVVASGNGTVNGATSADASAQSSNPTNSNDASSNNSDNGAGTLPANNTASAANANTAKPAPAPAVQPPVQRAKYNINETWYVSEVGVRGEYNVCWPTKITPDNDVACIDPNHIYSGKWLFGIGISKSPDEAYRLATEDADNKATAYHIDVRAGGGGDPTRLTETLCSQYSLSCGRW